MLVARCASVVSGFEGTDLASLAHLEHPTVCHGHPVQIFSKTPHGAETIIPNGDSCFYEGDTVVVVTSGRGVLQRINDIFA